jgi:hypothetical protein
LHSVITHLRDPACCDRGACVNPSGDKVTTTGEKIPPLEGRGLCWGRAAAILTHVAGELLTPEEGFRQLAGVDGTAEQASSPQGGCTR